MDLVKERMDLVKERMDLMKERMDLVKERMDVLLEQLSSTWSSFGSFSGRAFASFPSYTRQSAYSTARLSLLALEQQYSAVAESSNGCVSEKRSGALRQSQLGPAGDPGVPQKGWNRSAGLWEAPDARSPG
ncbi:hypothetical protein COCON_G00227940 [Conger conger]|uniref:Uncharacterized protein n=1 Tax=Conger conger TaxID=82655 RepID=A0A9Q1CV15_CONCO|nr:hypothetical protein COCON_G00227940 [Conger conger]